MSRHKHHLPAVVTPHRDPHRQTLLAVLYLCGVVLLINAWLISQQVINFG